MVTMNLRTLALYGKMSNLYNVIYQTGEMLPEVLTVQTEAKLKATLSQQEQAIFGKYQGDY